MGRTRYPQLLGALSVIRYRHILDSMTQVEKYTLSSNALERTNKFGTYPLLRVSKKINRVQHVVYSKTAKE